MEPEAYLTKKEAASKMRISERTIDYLRSAGKLSFFKIGSRVLFTLDDIKTYMESQRIVPVLVTVEKKNP